MRKLSGVVGILFWMGVASDAAAIGMGVEQVIPLNGAPENAEGIAVIYEGANAGIYIPHRDDSLVTVLDVDTGDFLFNFDSAIPVTLFSRGLRAIDVLPNGNLIIGQHTTNAVREVIIPPKPALSTTVPIATLGTISFTLPSHLDPAGTFAEFESMSAFAGSEPGQVFLLIGEEGRDVGASEAAGEVYIGEVSGAGLAVGSFEKLFSIPLTDGYDDISGIDVIDIVFDGDNIDRAASRILVSDDSSAVPNVDPPEAQSGLYVLDLFGQVLETLDGPGDGVENGFEEEFADEFPDQNWRDAEGVDYGEGPDGPRITIFFSDAGVGDRTILVFDDIVFEAAPEPATVGLLALGLAALAARRARR